MNATLCKPCMLCIEVVDSHGNVHTLPIALAACTAGLEHSDQVTGSEPEARDSRFVGVQLPTECFAVELLGALEVCYFRVHVEDAFDCHGCGPERS